MAEADSPEETKSSPRHVKNLEHVHWAHLIQEEFNRILNSGNSCYHAVHKSLSSRLSSKNIRITIYKTTILPLIPYGSETLSPTLKEEHRLSAEQNT
jgi:hypothetical protein